MQTRGGAHHLLEGQTSSGGLGDGTGLDFVDNAAEEDAVLEDGGEGGRRREIDVHPQEGRHPLPHVHIELRVVVPLPLLLQANLQRWNVTHLRFALPLLVQAREPGQTKQAVVAAEGGAVLFLFLSLPSSHQRNN